MVHSRVVQTTIHAHLRDTIIIYVVNPYYLTSKTANPPTQLTLPIKSHKMARENTIIYDLLGITVHTKCASPCIVYLCFTDLVFIVPVTKSFSNEHALPTDKNVLAEMSSCLRNVYKSHIEKLKKISLTIVTQLQPKQ